MNARQLFLVITQILDLETQGNPYPFYSDPANVPDRNAHPFVQRADNHGYNVSHITLEFVDTYRARFLTIITFDGTGDEGFDANSLFMPRMKLSLMQRCLVGLTMLDYLQSQSMLSARTAYVQDRIISSINGGSNRLLGAYREICDAAVKIDEEMFAAEEAKRKDEDDEDDDIPF